MPRPVCLFTGQWADLPLEDLCREGAGVRLRRPRARVLGRSLRRRPRARRRRLRASGTGSCCSDHGLGCFAISNHLVGQAVCDAIDERHQAILPAARVGRRRARGRAPARRGGDEATRPRAARRFFDAAPARREGRAASARAAPSSSASPAARSGRMAYAFPPVRPATIEAGFADFARALGRRSSTRSTRSASSFALEVHPTEIAFDIATARRALAAIGGHRALRLQLRSVALRLPGRRLPRLPARVRRRASSTCT